MPLPLYVAGPHVTLMTNEPPSRSSAPPGALATPRRAAAPQLVVSRSHWRVKPP